jgi:leader peptidase (prepilin peptidase)/N-methyltransferase
MQSLTDPLWLLVVAPFAGSFLGVLVARLPAGKPVLIARSACDRCERPLAVRDLVPVISWMVNRARCRHCGGAIGLFHPAVELGALLIAAWAVAVLPGWIAWAGAVFGWGLLVLAWTDARRFVLPDVITLPLGLAGLATAWLIDPASVVDHAIGATAGFASFAVFAAVYRAARGRDGLGFGDVKFIAALGAWVGWQGLPTLLLYAVITAVALVLAEAAFRRSLRLRRKLPFGPHLCLAGWLVWLYGPLSLY